MDAQATSRFKRELKGEGIAELWPQTLALLVLGAALFAIALAVFPRRLG